MREKEREEERERERLKERGRKGKKEEGCIENKTFKLS